MCKCCQSLLESCYWHCIEKWWCYDEKIALYEDPLSKEKDSRAYDNLAFWDSVSVIANRSVVTIQPLPEKPQLLTKDSKKSPELKITFKTHNETDKTDLQEQEQNLKTETMKARKKSAVEEKIEKRLMPNTENYKRRKSLKERRNSAVNLKLNLGTDFHEIPVIRQNSMPKFYMDTPDVPVDYENRPSSVLMSPVLPNTPTIHFDLKSIVQFEKEMEGTSKPLPPKRMTQIKKKMKPMLNKKPSTKSLPDTVNYI